MGSENLTVGDLFKAQIVTDEAINGAVDDILAGEMPEAYPTADGLALDIAAAAKDHTEGVRPAAEVLADPEVKPGFRRTMARSAVILARPVKA